MYLLKIAFRPWRHTPIFQFSIALSLGLFLFAITFLGSFERGLKPIVRQMSNERVLQVFVEAGTDEGSRAQIEDQVRVILSGESRTEVRTFTRADVLASLEKTHPTLGKELRGLSEREAAALVPEGLIVAGEVPQLLTEKIRKIEGVERVESLSGRFKNAVGAVQALRWMVRFLLLSLGLAMGIALLQLGRANQHQLGDAQQVLQAWGAQGWQIRLPGMISGAFVGLLSGGIACAGWLVFRSRAAAGLGELSPVFAGLVLPQPLLLTVILLLGPIFSFACVGAWRRV